MLNTLQNIFHLSHFAETVLYFTQAVTYAMAFEATRRGNHAPCQVYLASCLIHMTLAVSFCLPLA